MNRDDDPDNCDVQDPEEALRRLLRESANDPRLPSAKHKRYAKRAMRRRKESAHLLEAQSGRRDDTPLVAVRTNLTSKVRAIPPAPAGALTRSKQQSSPDVERLRAERRRLQEVVHKLRKDASDAKQELRFMKAELQAFSEREVELLRENQRLRRAILSAEASEEQGRERRFTGINARKSSSADGKTGTEE